MTTSEKIPAKNLNNQITFKAMSANFSLYRGQSGIALVTALLYLLVITFLAVSTFSTTLLQAKLSHHWHDQAQAFENAESALLVGEQAIQTGQPMGQGMININATYHYHLISRPECGLFYQVDAQGKSASAETHLQSVFMFPLAPPTPCTSVSPLPHQVMWLQQNTF